MRRYRLESIYTTQGWMRDCLASVSADGFITALEPAAAHTAGAEAVRGIVIPGMANAHSHAFQRAMAGMAEYRVSARDSFWTWRQAMYALANRIEPEQLQAIAAQLFLEMLRGGYTSVAEFHYLHRDRGGEPYGDLNPLWQAIESAAAETGIALTFLPTLYQYSDFGARPLRADQARFESDTHAFVSSVAARAEAEARSAEPRMRSHAQRTGAAFHSLRAVPLHTVREVAAQLRARIPGIPLHMHIAEQTLEVKACLGETGRRPIELLTDAGLLDANWCLVHATHATAAELERLAASGAAVCVSITTEANLGDGRFDATRFLGARGRLCIGSDSQASVSAAEELRWLEYQQRLQKRRRVVLATPGDPHAGTRLWRSAALAGAAALGQPAGELGVGRRADWLVLDAQHPSMAGAALDTTLDRLLFAGGEAAISEVMVAGHWVIRARRHAQQERIEARFAAAMARLAQP